MWTKNKKEIINNIKSTNLTSINSIKEDIHLDLKFEKSEQKNGTYLIVDVETTGLPKNMQAKADDLDNWPHIIQIAWLLFDSKGKLINSENHYIKTKQKISLESHNIHGIDEVILTEKGEIAEDVYPKFLIDLNNSEYIVAHFVDFDIPIIYADLLRKNIQSDLLEKKRICTMEAGKKFCKITKPIGIGYRCPQLIELYHKLFFSYAEKFEITELHDASVDTEITAKCFFELLKQGVIEV